MRLKTAEQQELREALANYLDKGGKISYPPVIHRFLPMDAGDAWRDWDHQRGAKKKKRKKNV